MTDTKETNNERLARIAVAKGTIDGHPYYIVKGRMWDNEELARAKEQKQPADIIKILQRISDEVGYNGYILFKKRPVREKGYKGILDYVPVHGGITYADEDNNGIVYGFDTAHAGQEGLPVRDMKWTRKQIRVMYAGILRAKKVEAKYLKALTNKGKTPHIVYVFGRKRSLKDLGFGAMINLMSNEL